MLKCDAERDLVRTPRRSLDTPAHWVCFEDGNLEVDNDRLPCGGRFGAVSRVGAESSKEDGGCITSVRKKERVCTPCERCS